MRVRVNWAATLALLVACCQARTTERFLWKTGGWGACYAAGGCGEGRRERQVWCAEDDGRTVLQFHCGAHPEPIRTKPCFSACRHHREKLQWQVSAWGPCLNVTRARAEMQLNQTLGPREDHGVMQRNVTCVLVVAHEAAKVLRPVDEDNCYRASRKPDPLRACHVPRPQSCVVGAWGPWTPCPPSCHSGNRTRLRPVLVAPIHGGKPCPQLTETRPCSPRVECLQKAVDSSLPPEYKLKLGAWRRCELPDSVALLGRDLDNTLYGGVSGPSPGGSSAESAENLLSYQPEVGYQTRDVSCGDSQGGLVDISLCLKEETTSSLPARVRPCILARDCLVTQWTPWARIQGGCVLPTEVRAEVHERRREVQRLREGDGLPCPHLIETRRITDRDQLPLCAHKYRWLVSKWSACVVTSEDGGLREVGCGGGVQLREATCVLALSNQPVDPASCDSLEPLPVVQRCEVACARDCEVASWQAWGPCVPQQCPPQHTQQAGYRERRRLVIVPSSERGLACPSLRETQPCAQPSCYRWSLGHWGSCHLLPGTKRCGEGTKTRAVTCTALDGSTVSDSQCSESPVKSEMEESCWLPCPYDCVLSPWSDWSPCSHSCSSPRQVALRQRNRTVIAPHGSGGHPCPDPDEMLQIEACNTHACHGFTWLPLPWQPCVALVSSRNISLNDTQTEGDSEPAGEEGEQKREVWCMEDNDHQVPDHNCRPLPKPDVSGPCSTLGRADCQMSPWSEWSSCPNECVPDASSEVRDGEVTPTQTRHRVVVQWPTGGGAECPPSEELRPCPLSAARCKHFLWGLGEWSDCQLPPATDCGMGYRTRGVWCYRNQRGARVSPGLCLEHLGEKAPAQWQTCFVDCKLPCVVSGWSEWTPCKQACQQRTQTRQLIGLWRNECTALDLKRSEPCPCERYTSVPLSDWSDCVLETDVTSVSANGRPALGVCGAGMRYRAQACYNENQELVEPSLCGQDGGLMEEPCLVACAIDCHMSEWGAWGDCSSLCGPGIHNRTRQVLVNADGSGRPCGELEQMQPCELPCAQYTWEASGWSDCQLIAADSSRGCGTGDQYRTVRCVRGGLEVADAHCDSATQPADINACHVACPGACVLSPWSEWSLCPQSCDASQERRRTRSVLRSGAAAHPACPPLIEVQACHVNTTCWSYEWATTEWSSCLPLGGSPCGEGVQSRAVFCRRSDGRPATDSWCAGELRPTLHETWCYVDCPVDCELSQWYAWNTSECQCGQHDGTKATRKRHIVTNPSPLGRPCPEPMSQEKPCPVNLCYSWITGPWGHCELQGAWCGHGLRTRNVSCVVIGSERTVEARMCEGDLPVSEPCYVPCSGDCHVSEWSHWSHCHRDCHGPDLVGGYQTRSRAVLRAPASEGEPCPSALWETRPCFSGPCLTFHWVRSKDGRFECHRSDGVPVVGGCDSKPKPCDGDFCGCPGDTVCPQEVTTPVGTTIQPDDEIQSLLYYPRDDEMSAVGVTIIALSAIGVVVVAISAFLLFAMASTWSPEQSHAQPPVKA